MQHECDDREEEQEEAHDTALEDGSNIVCQRVRASWKLHQKQLKTKAKEQYFLLFNVLSCYFNKPNGN